MTDSNNKILLLSKYSRAGASSRLRSLQYVDYLESRGFDVEVSSLFDDDYLRGVYNSGRRSLGVVGKAYMRRFFSVLRSSRYDMLWVEYEVFPYFPAGAEFLLSFFGVPYIVDFDDAVFHNYDLSGSRWMRSFLGRKIDVVMQRAACVVAGNDYLAERARRAGAARVEFIPTVVDRDRYVVKNACVDDQLVIGWIGSPSTQKYVVGIRDALASACRLSGARLMLVGATPQVVEDLPGVDVEVVSWSEETEVDAIRRMDIGIMPLPDGPWERGKCGYKLIQYMACAVPVVASPVGVNVDIVGGSDCGLLCREAEQWKDGLLKLLGSPGLRSEFGAAGRRAVEKTYSMQVQAPALSRIFKSVIEKSRA